jgi:hypothetical protein
MQGPAAPQCCASADPRSFQPPPLALLLQWSKMHGLRTVLGAVALGASLYGTHTLLTSK